MKTKAKLQLSDTITKSDLEFVVIAATRYALGRMTYSTSIMEDVITNGAGQMTDNCLSVLLRDIKEHGERGVKTKLNNLGYGHECDYQAWMSCLRALENEIKRREGTK